MIKDLKIFICAHKPIENKIPEGKEYVIVAQNDSIVDENHDVIYLTNDEFTKKHWRCYSEGCAIRYLWKHPELLPKYVGIAHYRRFFLDFVGRESMIPLTLNKYKAIVSYPFIFDGKRLKNNYEAQFKDHFKEDADVLKQVVSDLYPKYGEAYKKRLQDSYFFPCNLVIMKKKDFLEMCTICFNILDEFDRRMNYVDNDAVYRKILYYHKHQRVPGSVAWQSRLQGFFLEWLTDAYYYYKFGVNNCYVSKIGIPGEKPISTYETYSSNREWINRLYSGVYAQEGWR